MEISIISIGNSKGIRLSKSILEQYNITGTLEMILEKDYIILKPKNIPRKGWEKSFQKMNEVGDDSPLMKDFFEDEKSEEWS